QSANPGTAVAPTGQKGAPATLQTNVSPNALSKDKTLPGMKGGSPLPSGTTGPVPGVATPGAKLVPENKSATTTPTTTSPAGPASGTGAGGNPKTPATTGPVPSVTNPSAKLTPDNKSSTTTPATAGPASGAGAAGGPKTLEMGRKPKDVLPPPPSAKPAAAPAKPPPPVAHVEPARRPPPPPPPPPHPAPQVARPAPPPPPRPVAQVARPAPPKPAAPAAAKKCPPNNPKC
ncbi:MAG: hypothetical protein P4M05_00930, partial [Bradyrhizobium sp.]|nr:hypothetical protein [Bradyrhizobium sp.]